MDIEITADNVMNYMGDENIDDEQFKAENQLMESLENTKKDKDDKKETR